MLVFTIAELVLLLVSAVACLAFSGVQMKALWRAAAVFTIPALLIGAVHVEPERQLDRLRFQCRTAPRVRRVEV